MVRDHRGGCCRVRPGRPHQRRGSRPRRTPPVRRERDLAADGRRRKPEHDSPHEDRRSGVRDGRTPLAPGAAYEDTGIVTAEIGDDTGYEKFKQSGDVIVYRPDGSDLETPIIHRARFWVGDGENWYDEANPEFLAGADNCAELANCPAPHAGFITKGDANPQYDQVGVSAISEPIRPSWVIGTAEFRIPWLGWVRLAFSEAAAGAVAIGTVRRTRFAGQTTEV